MISGLCKSHVQVDNLIMLTAAKKAGIIMLALYVATLQWGMQETAING